MRLKGMAVAVLIVALAALSTPSLAGVSKVAGGIEFTYEDPSAGSVSLAGNFNNWNMNADKLTQDNDGVWRIVVDLSPGEYEYKFVVNGSEWIADPDNPRVVGSYGNSGLTVNDKGEPVAAVAGGEARSNTPANVRVRLDGWYRATYDTRSDVKRDPRWRLSRPAHELYLNVKPTVTDVASGSAVLHLTTGTGDIKELTADIYSGHVTLEGGPFTAIGFYNEERVQFDDPLETVGHRDLFLTIPEEEIPFGRGAQGLIIETGAWGASLEAVYANEYDYDIMDKPSIYDNTETDLLAARLKRKVGPVALGLTYTSWRDGWWIDWTGGNSNPQIDEYRATHPESRSDWFELARTESWAGIDASVPLLQDRITLTGEVALYGYDNRFDMGNKEKVEGESYANGAIDVPVGDTDGLVSKVIVGVTPAQPVDLQFEGVLRSIDSMNPDELYIEYTPPSQNQFYVPYGTHNWLATVEDQYTEVKFNDSPLTVDVYGPAPKREETELEFDGMLSFGIFDVTLEYDYDSYKWTYVEPLDTYYGSVDEWKQCSTRVAGMATVSLSDRVEVGLASDLISRNYENSHWKDPSLVQVIGTADVGLWENWKILVNVRRAEYSDFARYGTDVPDTIDYGDGTYVDPYVALVYSPRDNVEIRVGYGVDPMSYVDTPVEGRADGRERWISQYLWDHSDYDWLDAEQALEDARTIGIMALLTF